MEKVYAHREFGLEANIIGCATYDLKTTKPKREDLRREIEQQKEFYRLQHKEDK